MTFFRICFNTIYFFLQHHQTQFLLVSKLLKSIIIFIKLWFKQECYWQKIYWDVLRTDPVLSITKRCTDKNLMKLFQKVFNNFEILLQNLLIYSSSFFTPLFLYPWHFYNSSQIIDWINFDFVFLFRRLL